MICVEHTDGLVGHDEPWGDCSWSTIAEAIRKHARKKPDDVAEDLNQWADLLEGIGELGKAT